MTPASKYWSKVAAMMIAIALVATFTANAKVYTWDKYDIAFDAPEGGYVPYSFFQDPSSAQVNWDEMVMTLQHYVKNENTTKKNLEERLKSRAMGYNMYDTEMVKIKVKGFKCHAIEGTMPDGTRCISGGSNNQELQRGQQQETQRTGETQAKDSEEKRRRERKKGDRERKEAQKRESV